MSTSDNKLTKYPEYTASLTPEQLEFVKSHFPYKSYGATVGFMKQAFQQLSEFKLKFVHHNGVHIKNMGITENMNVVINAPSTYHNIDILIELFASGEEMRIQVKKMYNYKGKVPRALPSIAEKYADDKALGILIDQCFRERKVVNAHNLRETIYLHWGDFEAAEFKPSLAAGFIQHYKAKRVLDPCQGRCARLLGALAKGAQYYGVDPDPRVKLLGEEIYEKMDKVTFPKENGTWNQISKMPTAPKFATCPFEDVDLVALGATDVDMVLTCPPYYDYEIYAEDEDQSVSRYKTLDEWIEGFMKPLYRKSYEALKKGGHAVYFINDVPQGAAPGTTATPKYVDRCMKWACTPIADGGAGFVLVEKMAHVKPAKKHGHGSGRGAVNPISGGQPIYILQKL